MELIGTTALNRQLATLLEEKKLKPSDFSLNEMARAYMGEEWVANLKPKSGSFVSRQALMEADGGAVAYQDFGNITGQIYFNYIREAYEMPEFVFSKLVPTRPTDILDMERIPGMSQVGDEFSIIPETGEYPNFGYGEDYIDIAFKQKRGGKIGISKEMILGDKTGLAMERAKKIGWWLGWNKEKRILDALIDENQGAKSPTLGGHRFRWRGTDYATYQTSAPWINQVKGNPLVSWVSIQASWYTLAQITDPFTGEPVMIQPTHLIVSPQLEATAWRILNSIDARTHVGGYAQTGNLIDYNAKVPIDEIFGKLKLATSRLLIKRSTSQTDWWLSAPEKQCAYFSNWDVETEEAPSFTQDQFDRDIVFQIKASEMGCASTLEPRVACENNA